MLSLKLRLFLCILFVIGMEGAPEPKPEDLHIHLNLHDPTGAAKEGFGVAQAAGDYGLLEDLLSAQKHSDPLSTQEYLVSQEYLDNYS